MKRSLREQDGTWIQTFTGRRFWPLDPHPEDVAIEDVAHALSMKCRYNGHCRRYYSVAEHSLLVCEALTRQPPANRWLHLQALLHDAAEAYLPDVCRPVKPRLTGFAAVERAVELAIQQRFGLLFVGNGSPAVKAADTAILYDEALALMPIESIRWHERFRPGLGVRILGLTPGEAEAAFLETFERLNEGVVA